VIGPLIGADEVCDAVEATLAVWFPSAVAEIAAAGGPALALPTSYDMPDAAALRAGNAVIPAVVVSSPGLASAPVRDEEGAYRASWRVVVTAFARGNDYRDTARTVRGYALAIRTALVQHPSLGGFAAELTWDGEEYAALDSAAARTIGGAFVTFTVTVADVTDATAGPIVPPPATALVSPADPTVTSADLLVLREP
jgi:hypothetical protein